jgi:hypothetical protein
MRLLTDFSQGANEGFMMQSTENRVSQHPSELWQTPRLVKQHLHATSSVECNVNPSLTASKLWSLVNDYQCPGGAGLVIYNTSMLRRGRQPAHLAVEDVAKDDAQLASQQRSHLVRVDHRCQARPPERSSQDGHHVCALAGWRPGQVKEVARQVRCTVCSVHDPTLNYHLLGNKAASGVSNVLDVSRIIGLRGECHRGNFAVSLHRHMADPD